ncbi:MAG: tetratricopeptide repeat protein [Chloroflexi bacterium]|nr:tetratricopeptide repeat protein [Chloroflexota bacterium]
MRIIDFHTSLDKLDSSERTSCIVRSLKHDSMIWSFLLESPQDIAKLIDRQIELKKINPGILGLISLNPELIENQYPDFRLHSSFLEDCMNEYEIFLQQHVAPVTLIQSTKLAIILIEKRKISQTWSNVLQEILTRNRISTAEDFYDHWRTPLAIVINLITDPSELLTDLCQTPLFEKSVKIFIQLLLCLPLAEIEISEKIELFTKGLSPQNKEKILRNLIAINENNLAKEVAIKYTKEFETLELESYSTEKVWDSPEKTFQNALFYQQVAGIAQVAEKLGFSLSLINKSSEILKAISMGMNIQKLAIENLSENNSALNKLVGTSEGFGATNVEINNELAYAGYLSEDVYPKEFPDQAYILVQRLKSYLDTGNTELVSKKLEQLQFLEEEIEVNKLLRIESRFNPKINTARLISLLSEVGALSLAEKLSRKLTEINPSSEDLNRRSAEVFLKSNNAQEALPFLETLVMFGDNSIELQRSLAKSYKVMGDPISSYRYWKKIKAREDSEERDLLDFAESAIENQFPEEATETMDLILSLDPDHSGALAIKGNANFILGNIENAIDLLEKAIDLGGESAKPWISLALIYEKKNEHDKAIDLLRNGVFSLPNNVEIKKVLAELLMKKGSIAEAFPFLNELAEKNNDLDINLLQMKAMKALALEDYSDCVTKMYRNHPENGDVIIEYAEELIRTGKRDEAKPILTKQLILGKMTEQSNLVYADVIAGLDFENIGFKSSVTNKEEKIARKIIEERINIEPENIKARILSAELNLQKGNYTKSFDQYSTLLEKSFSIDKAFIERLKAGFALAAAHIGKFELALAAIKEAVDARPGWIGLRKTLATVYSITGQISEAIVQAEKVLELAPQIVENLIWFAELLQGMGMKNEAEKLLREQNSLQPSNLMIAAKLIEYLHGNGKELDAKDCIDEIRPSLKNFGNEKDLILISKLFNLTGATKDAQEYLEKRKNIYPSPIHQLDLAGFYYLQGQYTKTIEELNYFWKMDDPNVNVNYLIADTLENSNSLQSAYELIKSTDLSFLDVEIDLESVFIPESWKKFVNKGDLEFALSSRISYKLGLPAQCLSDAEKWIEHHPETDEARIIAIEASMASGDLNHLSSIFNFSQSAENTEIRDHLMSLKLEYLLNNDQIIDAQRLYIPRNSESICYQALGIKIKNLSGAYVAGDNDFKQSLKLFQEKNDPSEYIQIGIIRNLVKVAAELDRWGNALPLIQKTAKRFPWNLEIVKDFLINLVRAKEFENSFSDLCIQDHGCEGYFSSIQFEDELKWVENQSIMMKFNDKEKWIKRGEMANSPTKENIRAFALMINSPEEAIAMIHALYATGQAETALQEAKKHKSIPSVILELSGIQADSHPSESLAALDQLLLEQPQNVLALARKSYILGNTGKLDLAAGVLEDAINIWPKEINWRIQVSGYWEKLGNASFGIVHLEVAHEIQPKNLEIALLLAKAYLSIQDGNNCVEILEPYRIEYPNRYELWEELADGYIQAGDQGSALKAAETASKANPFSTKPYLLSGKINLDKGDFETALEQAKYAVSKNNQDAEAMVFLAKVLYSKGEKNQALEVLELASKCKNTTVQNMIDHVNLIKEINGATAGNDLIKNLSGKYPENFELLKMLATNQKENGELQQAEQTAQRALLLNPEESDLHLLLGKIKTEEGNLDQAVYHITKGIAQGTKNPEGYLLLSKIYEQQREYTKSLETITRAIELNPKDSSCYIAAANLYRNSKNYAEAEKLILQAIEIAPKDLTLRRQLGALLALKLVHQSQEASSKK